MNKLPPPESDRCWPVGRSGVAGLTPVSRGSIDKAPPHQSKDACDPFSGGPDPKRVEPDSELERDGKPQTAEELSQEIENHLIGAQASAEGHRLALLKTKVTRNEPIEDLVSQGVTRERAEKLVEAYGTEPERLKAEVWVEENLHGSSKGET